MGKLHYQSRKVEGIKAGQVVAKDLRKRVTSGTSGKAAARDPTLELDITGRRLTDAGFDEFMPDLLACIRFRDKDRPEGAAKVADFILQENELTAKSLPKLTEVVALSAGDLRELDVSDNKIQIETSEDKAAWLAFLQAFAGCYMLKKLNLGGNKIGTAGMEILARVYTKSDLDFVEGDAHDVLGSKTDDESGLAENMEAMDIKSGKENEPAKSRSKKTFGKSKTSKSNATQSSTKVTQADLKRYACTRGIRSIPYLIISNTCNTNAGAIHLSSMLSMQRSTQQLLEFLPPGKTGGLPDTAGQCKGIIWLPNEMDMVAKKMLDMGEAIRKLTSGDSDSDEEQDEPRRSSTGSESQDDTTSPCRDHASQRKMQKHLESEYRRVTKRVRMETLKNVSVHEVELWSTAIKMLVVARALLLDDGDRVDKTSPESSPQEEVTDEQELEHKDSSAELVEMFQHYPLTASIDSFEPVPSNYDIEFPAICVTKPDGEVMELIEAVSKTSTPTPTATSDPQPAPRQRKGIARSHSSTTAAQKVSGPGGLAIETWRAIIEEVVDGKGILTRGQQMQIIRYASDWDVIAYKMTIQGVEDYQQIWKFLETVGCFTYSPESQ